jgi:capsule polysaccharide export protein KpsE/RkpR
MSEADGGLDVAPSPRSEARQNLLKISKQLQQYVSFKAGVEPHIEHLQADVKSLEDQIASHNAKIKEMEAQLKAPDSVGQSSEEDREKKLATIRELESQYEHLLTEKAKYLELGEQQTGF